jgi:hypothetical protein
MYPERKPIYETYKSLVKEIIESKRYKEYAEGEIDALDRELQSAFRDIRRMLMMGKEWPKGEE